MAAEPGRLLIRADAGPVIGAGHLMRCLALAQRWQAAGGDATFLLAEGGGALVGRIRSEGMDVRSLEAPRGSPKDAEQTGDLADRLAASWLVADGYNFGAEYQRILKGRGARLLLLDDFGHAERYYADVILNQNLGARKAWYKERPAGTRLLQGTQYALLRREFEEWRDWVREAADLAQNVLVTLGHSDLPNITLRVIQALKALNAGELRATIVVGADNPHQKDVAASVEAAAAGVRLVRDPINMPKLMAAADMAIAAGGSTSWELAFMGLPTLTVVLAENQRGIAENLEREGLGWNAGWHGKVSAEFLARKLDELRHRPEVRRSMAERGRALVDGRGAERVVEVLRRQVRGQ